MTESGLDRAELKEMLKEALAEILIENREIFHEVFAEVLEDFIHTQIMRDEDRPKNGRKGDVFPIIEGKA